MKLQEHLAQFHKHFQPYDGCQLTCNIIRKAMEQGYPGFSRPKAPRRVVTTLLMEGPVKTITVEETGELLPLHTTRPHEALTDILGGHVSEKESSKEIETFQKLPPDDVSRFSHESDTEEQEQDHKFLVVDKLGIVGALANLSKGICMQAETTN